MAKLDIGEALGEGFRLLGRRPLDTLVWGAAYFVFGVLPMFAIMAWAAGDIIALMKSAQAGASGFNTQQAMATQLKFQALQPLMFVSSLVGRTLVYAAVFRAVLTPQDRGFFYLRFSSTELWVGLVMLVQAVCMFLVMVALMLPAMLFWIPVFVSAAHQSFSGWEIPLGMLAMLAAFVVLIWLFIRFSMALPMTFTAGTFRLFESWSLTRGHALGLLGLYIVVAVVVGCIAAVVECLVLAVVFAVVAGMGFNAGAVEAFFRQSPEAILAAIAPLALGVALVGSLLMGPFMALFLGPWARAYAQLETKPAEAF